MVLDDRLTETAFEIIVFPNVSDRYLFLHLPVVLNFKSNAANVINLRCN